MDISIKTVVEQPLDKVFAQFTGDLLAKLSPPFPIARLRRYDGEQVGDVVQIELDFLLFKQQWISKITERLVKEEVAYFVDEGVQLPFFLRTWRHEHRVEKRSDGGCVILDNISFTSHGRLATFLVYPLIYGLFLYRKPIYRRLFALKNQVV